MLAPPLISVPPDSSAASDGGYASGQESLVPSKFPHTRSQLVVIARHYKPNDVYDSDIDSDESGRITSSFVSQVANLLDSEQEEELKALLKENFGDIEEEELEQHVLDLMHKHRDDVDNVPFLFLTPTRRPISRPSSRASNTSRTLTNRPDTPQSAPSSPLAMIFRRPHTPITSPLGAQAQANSYMSARSESPNLSPIIGPQHYATSLPASPISSPRLLNAKASEFKPIPRPLSAASSNPGSLAALRDQTPSPDLWSTQNRPTSKLAIAAPLTPDSALLPRAVTPSSSLRSSLRPDEQDEDDDPFDPFRASSIPRSFHPVTSNDLEAPWSNSGEQPAQDGDPDMDPEAAAMLTDGMTPLDVLSSVFGATLAPSELEEALANNGYDFDRAMTWLVDRQMNNPLPNAHQPRMQSMGRGVTMVSREGGMVRGGRAGFNNMAGPGRNGPRYVNGRPLPGNNRVCRYFLAGECLRADCRFSHDLERALCRFWLRGTCAKGDACEFLHHLPENIDVSTVTHAMNSSHITPVTQEQGRSASPDEFPTLNHAVASSTTSRGRGAPGQGRETSAHDPSRTRFAAAVKKAPPAPPAQGQSAKDSAVTRRDPPTDTLHTSTAVVAPKPSPRIKLRPPTLLPTLPTGESVNSLYMAYRSRALRLGAARNACLSRAADAWRRGDGAAAKRFSREGHDLNAKMSSEMVEAAGKLVRERAHVAEQAVRSREASWSDDYGDRTARGRICAKGLGVCLGIASTATLGDSGNKLSPEERTEVMLDLHGLHAAEATEVLEEFLLALEKEPFYGLAYLVVGEEKHTGTQDPARGASRARLAAGVREWLHTWGYPWSERDGAICVDPLTHA
ncbi:hypothetical protein CERSUDRAFT_81811 [Gelatoporia subvermispora B]|uniref:Uncharacterized protein n=1 Tax=Ceriporiopsis subvermispora (strain B) TaxID=914234 RepID=M2RJR6_CERS8|nr:hypothetical protein CERSUDRAFT_81811 [Gelatoporia subvermispora B]